MILANVNGKLENYDSTDIVGISFSLGDERFRTITNDKGKTKVMTVKGSNLVLFSLLHEFYDEWESTEVSSFKDNDHMTITFNCEERLIVEYFLKLGLELKIFNGGGTHSGYIPNPEGYESPKSPSVYPI